MSTTAHFQVIHMDRARTVSIVSWGWKRMPPLQGPRASLCWQRKPRKTRTPPSSMGTGMETWYSRRGDLRRSRVGWSSSRRSATESNCFWAISNALKPLLAMNKLLMRTFRCIGLLQREGPRSSDVR